MAKSVHNNVLDAALNYLKNNVILMILCSEEPTTYTGASATYMLGNVTMASTDFTGPADGDTSGRKIAVNQMTDTVTNSGTGTHIALCSTDTLLYVTTCTSQVVTADNPLTINAWDIEIADPA